MNLFHHLKLILMRTAPLMSTCPVIATYSADIVDSIQQSTKDAEDGNDDAGTLFPRLLSVELILVS